MVETANVESTVGRRQLVVFSLADEAYGVDIYKIREIIRVPAITKVPRAPEYVEGVINLPRGRDPRFGSAEALWAGERRRE